MKSKIGGLLGVSIGLLASLFVLSVFKSAWSLLNFDSLGRPVALLLLLLILPLLGLAWHAQRRRQERLNQLIENPLWERMHISPSTLPHWTRLALWVFMLISLSMALARPQGPPVLTESESSGIEVLVALDISDSMRATDEHPSRLAAAKNQARELMRALEGDRIGFIVFSGEAFSIAPFSSDHDALESILYEVSHDLLPSSTTDLEEVLALVKERFERSRKQEAVGQILVLMSDGENQLGDYENAAKALAKDGVRIYTVGTGSERGARIPERDPIFGLLAYKKWQGQEVVTRLDDRVLKKLAQWTQGEYLPLNKARQLKDRINAVRGKLMSRSVVGTGVQSYEERFVYWLLLTLLFLALERSMALWLSLLQHIKWPRRSDFAKILDRVSKRPQAVSLLLFPLLMGAWHWPWEAYWNDRKGQAAYENKDFEAAQKSFESGLEAAPEQPALQYNLGNSLYQQKKYQDAGKNFQTLGENPQLAPQQRSSAYYNLGNSYFRQGEQNPQQAQQAWKKSIESYEKALQYDPQNKEAVDNLNYVQHRLEDLKKQQQQKQKQQDQEGDKGQQNQQQKQGQNQNDQEQNQQNQQNQQQSPPSQGEQQNPNPNKAEHSPLDNRYTDEEFDKYLDYLKNREREQHNPNQFQRRPSSKEPRNPFDRSMQQDSQIKDW